MGCAIPCAAATHNLQPFGAGQDSIPRQPHSRAGSLPRPHGPSNGLSKGPHRHTGATAVSGARRTPPRPTASVDLVPPTELHFWVTCTLIFEPLARAARHDRRRARPGHAPGGEGMQTVGPEIFNLARLSPRFRPASRHLLKGFSSKGPPETQNAKICEKCVVNVDLELQLRAGRILYVLCSFSAVLLF